MKNQIIISQANQSTQKLINSIREDGSMGLVAAARDLMPAGKPDFSKIKSYPSISQLIPTVGAPTLHKLLMVLIKNYCNSVNVPEGKNMNEDQIIEAAGFLLDECDNYRIEDYVMMFTLAKRGKLESGKTGRIFDRVDIQLISDFKANYEQMRAEEGYKIQERQLREKEFGKDLVPVGNYPKQRENFEKAMEILKQQLSDMAEMRDAESKKHKEFYRKKQEELFLEIQELAKKNGYEGDLIDLSPFKQKK